MKNKNTQPAQLFSARKSEKSFDKNKTLNLRQLRGNRLHTTNSEEKKSSRGKQEHSGSETKRRSNKKAKVKAHNNLALNLLDAYFQKPLESGIKTSAGTGKKVKLKEQQAEKQFQDNLKKLKEGFLKLPKMKKEGERLSTSKNTARKKMTD